MTLTHPVLWYSSMHTLALYVNNLQTESEMASFTHSKYITSNQKFRRQSRDSEHTDMVDSLSHQGQPAHKN